MSAETREDKAEGARETEQDEALGRDQGGGEPKDEAGPGEDQRRIDARSDRYEIEPEQQPLERLDRHLDLAAVFRFREQKSGDEGAERHRQMARRSQQAVAEHHKETGRHEELGAPRLGDEMEERAQRQPAEHDQRRQRKSRGDQRLQ